MVGRAGCRRARGHSLHCHPHALQVHVQTENLRGAEEPKRQMESGFETRYPNLRHPRPKGYCVALLNFVNGISKRDLSQI